VENNRVFVRDLGSSNGVVVEGQRVREAELLNGQRVQVGDYLLQLVQDDDSVEISLDTGSLSGDAEVPLVDLATPSFGAAMEDPIAAETEGRPQSEPLSNEAEPDDNPFGELPDWDGDGGFGSGGLGEGFGGGFGADAGAEASGGFGEGTAQAESPEEPYGALPQAQPEIQASASDSKALSAAKVKLKSFKASLHRIPWAPKLSALLLSALLLVMLAPGGGILALLAKAESTMEKMSVAHAIQLARVSASDNELLIPREGGGYELRQGSVKSLQRVSGVTPGGAVIVDMGGYIKVPPDKVGSKRPKGVPELMRKAVNSKSVAQDWNGSLVRILAPIRSYESRPAQVVGGVYMEYEPTEFVLEVGRPTSLALIAFVVISLIFGLIFTITWRMTNEPIKAIREETELAIKGHQPLVNFETHWPEMEDLIHTINRALLRAGSGGGHADRQLESLVGLSAWPIILTDGDLRVTAANPVAARVLGGDVQKALGKPLSSLVTNPDLAEKMKALFSKLGGSQGKQGSDSVVIDGHQRKLSIAVETSTVTGKLEYAVVVIA
jgi:PAS domain-containing protein